MARIRSVHPGLFTDEAFMQASPLARLLLIGLWTEADDQGVFEWKPLTLKARILPVNDADLPVLLAELGALNFIRRYEHGSRSFGAIRNFRRYQRPKKPNAMFFIPDEFRTYVALDEVSEEETSDNQLSVPPISPAKADSSTSVPNQFPTTGEKSSQMEDGGGRREEEQETTRHGRTRADGDVLMAKLTEAAGKALANPAGSPGLLVLSEPLRWLDGGCDLDLDILPTIAARCSRSSPGSKRSWSYFSDAVFAARDARTRPAPEPSNDPTPNSRLAPRTSNSELLVSGMARALKSRGGGDRGGSPFDPGFDDADRCPTRMDAGPGIQIDGFVVAGRG